MVRALEQGITITGIILVLLYQLLQNIGGQMARNLRLD